MPPRPAPVPTPTDPPLNGVWLGFAHTDRPGVYRVDRGYRAAGKATTQWRVTVEDDRCTATLVTNTRRTVLLETLTLGGMLLRLAQEIEL